MNWRITLLKVLFLLIPATGIWCYSKTFGVEADKRHYQCDVKQLATAFACEDRMVELRDFKIRDDQSVIEGRNEFMIADAVDEEDWAYSVLLRRNVNGGEGLQSIVDQGVVSGTFESFVERHLVETLGIQMRDSDPGDFVVLDVDQDRLATDRYNIVKATFGFSVLGFIGLVYFGSKFDETEFQDGIRRNRVQSQVALQLLIARHDNFKHY